MSINNISFLSIHSHFRLILTPRREVIHSNFKAYEVNADGKEKTIHLGMTIYIFKKVKFKPLYFFNFVP